MSNEQEIQSYFNIYRELEAQLNVLGERMVIIENYRKGILMTRGAIEELKNTKPNHEIMLPIGNSAFIKARTIDLDNFIIAIGKDILVERNAEQALDWVSKVEEDYEKAYQLIRNQIQDVSNQMEKIRPQLEKYYNQMNPTRRVSNPNNSKI